MSRDYALDAAGVFPAGNWIRATACGPDGGNCVEVNLGVAGRVALRDSKRSRSPVLVCDYHEWRSFLTVVCADRYHHRG